MDGSVSMEKGKKMMVQTAHKLIDADVLFSRVTKELGVSTMYLPIDFQEMIVEQPPVDVVQVIRCKDCKYYEDVAPIGCCGAWDAKAVYPDDYCSDGERRTDETDYRKE